MPLQIITAYDDQGRPYTTWTNTDYPQNANAPGPKAMPPLDFSAAETEERPSESSADHFIEMEGKGAPEQGPVQAKAYYQSQGASYDPSGLAKTPESEFSQQADKDFASGRPEEWWQDRKLGPSGTGGGRMSGGGSTGGGNAPQETPYTPPQLSYSDSSYGGLGAANKPTVWGASYGGAGVDPYLKSMQNMAKPFEDFFTQMQFNHF